MDTLQETFSITKLVLIDSFRKGGITAIALDGHTSITGVNGAGKTSLLRLIPIFYGESPNRLVKGDGKVNHSFLNYYLPHTTSYIIFEYLRRGKPCMAVLHAANSGESVCYRFIDQAFDRALFTYDAETIVPASKLSAHIGGIKGHCSRQLTASEYRAVIQNMPKSSYKKNDSKEGGGDTEQKLAAMYSFVSARGNLSHIEKTVTSIFSRDASFADIKRMVVSCIQDGDTEHRLEANKSDMDNAIREYRAYTGIMGMTGRMDDLVNAKNRHDELTRSIQRVHTDLACCAQQYQRDLDEGQQALSQVDRKIEAFQAQARLDGKSMVERRAHAEAALTEATNAVKRIKDQQREYEAVNITALALEVERIPELERDRDEQARQHNLLVENAKDIEVEFNRQKQERQAQLHVDRRDAERKRQPIQEEANQAEAASRTGIAERLAESESRYSEALSRIAVDKQAASVKMGSAQHSVTHAPASAESIAARDKAHSRVRLATEALFASKEARQQTEQALAECKASFSAVEGIIRGAKKDLQENAGHREHLLSLKNAAPGTLLHFLREQHPGWVDDIARVVPEDLLLRSDLSPRTTEPMGALYGVELNLSVIEPPRAADESAIAEALAQNDQERADIEARLTQADEQLAKASADLKAAESQRDASRREVAAKEEQLNEANQTLKQAEINAANSQREAREAASKLLHQIREELQALNQSEATVKNNQQAEKRQLDGELAQRLGTIQQERDTKLREVDARVSRLEADCQAACDAINQLMKASLQANGVDVDALTLVAQALEKTNTLLRAAKQAEPKVVEWRRWQQSEWADMPNKEHTYQQAAAALLALETEEKAAKEKRASEEQALDDEKRQIVDQQSTTQRRLSSAVSHMGKLSAWPADPIGPNATPLRELALLEGEVERLQTGIRDEAEKGREAASKIKHSLVMVTGSSPYTYYEKVRRTLPAEDEQGAFAWYEPLKGWFDETHKDTRQVILTAFDSLGVQINVFHEKLMTFNKSVASFSRELQHSMVQSTRFRAIKRVTPRITTALDQIEGLDYIKAFKEEYSAWNAHRDSGALPPRGFAEALEGVSRWLTGNHTLTVKYENLIDLEIDIDDGSAWVKTARNQSQIPDVSSHGLSYLVLCILFVGLINKIRKGQPVSVMWALDELRDLDSANVVALLAMLADNNIHLVTAFPDADPDILGLVKNRFEVLENRKIACLVLEEDHV